MANITPQQTNAKVPGLDTLTIVRQLGLLVAVAVSVAIGAWVVLWSQEPNYGVLFGNIDKSEASQVLDALQQLNISYHLDESTGAIMVPSKDLNDARIKLAAQGLPRGTVGGGFSGMSGGDSPFGMSEAKENVLFQRELEQELARTINSISNVKTARVHLAIPKKSLFLRDRQKPRASVVVSLYSGRNLSEGQVAAIVHMVSSSVPNLDVENVTLVDQKGSLLSNGENSKEMAISTKQFDYARKLESSYVARIEDILTPILGSDAIRAQVTADIDFTESEQTQETYNPDTPTARSTQVKEEQSSGSSGVGGVPGALSNQPPGAGQAPETTKAATGQAGNESNHSTRTETRNYELDRTINHTRFATGKLRRLSVAVVIDDKLTTNESGTTVRTERSPEEIERITGLVKKAMGFDIQRGDSVNIINAAFTVPAAPQELPAPSLLEQAWLWDVVKQGLGGLVILIILFGVLKPAIKNLSKSIAPVMHVPALPNGADAENDQLQIQQEKELKKLAGPKTPYEQNMQIAHDTVIQDPKLVAQVVKSWVTKYKLETSAVCKMMGMLLV